MTILGFVVDSVADLVDGVATRLLDSLWPATPEVARQKKRIIGTLWQVERLFKERDEALQELGRSRHALEVWKEHAERLEQERRLNGTEAQRVAWEQGLDKGQHTPFLGELDEMPRNPYAPLETEFTKPKEDSSGAAGSGAGTQHEPEAAVAGGSVVAEVERPAASDERSWSGDHPPPAEPSENACGCEESKRLRAELAETGKYVENLRVRLKAWRDWARVVVPQPVGAVLTDDRNRELLEKAFREFEAVRLRLTGSEFWNGSTPSQAIGKMFARLRAVQSGNVKIAEQKKNLEELVVKRNKENAELLERVAKGGQYSVRPELARFANQMEDQLKANDHKEGWRSSSMHSLLARLIEEVAEVVTEYVPDAKAKSDFDGVVLFLTAAKDTLRKWGHYLEGKPSQTFVAECADVANFCMMLADLAANPATAEERDGRPAELSDTSLAAVL